MALWPSVSVYSHEHPVQLPNIVTDLYKQASTNQWLEPAEDEEGTAIPMLRSYRGVVLQREDGNYVAHPPNLNTEVIQAVLRLDVPVAFTMSSETTATLIRQTDPDQTQLGDRRSGIVLPVIDSVESLASGRVNVPQDCFICLCRKEQFVLVWGDTVRTESGTTLDIHILTAMCNTGRRHPRPRQ